MPRVGLVQGGLIVLSRALVSRRYVPVVGLLLCIALGGLMFSSAPALAVRVHIFSTSFGGEGTGNSKFKGPTGVAVNEATGDVYVVDSGNNRVEQFSSAGAYIGQFNGSAAPTGVLKEPTWIAVDNSGNPLDPSHGDVYVADGNPHVVYKFSESGVYEGEISEAEAGSPFSALEGVAVDPSGTLWVSQASVEIDSFSDALVNKFLSKRSSYGGAPGFAVDSEDNLYVDYGIRFLKLNSAGAFLSEMEAGESYQSTAAAVDSHNNVYIDNVTTVGLFSPSGSLIERFGSEHLTGGSGVAVNSAAGLVYIADSAADTDRKSTRLNSRH